MKVPHKIHLFAWRACKEDLPSLQNLIKRKVPLDNVCAFCHDSTKDIATFYFLQSGDT